jgi:hypothetical protein
MQKQNRTSPTQPLEERQAEHAARLQEEAKGARCAMRC